MHMCHGHPTFNRNPYNGYIKPYYCVDDHPLLYGNNGSLDPPTYELRTKFGTWRRECNKNILKEGEPLSVLL